MKKALLLKLFDAFTVQRWNDRIRPIRFVEMDKHAHKMGIVYCLARYEEDRGRPVNWHNLIRGGIFELLRRIVLSDIKSPVHRRIKEAHPEVFRRLNLWVYDQLHPCIDSAELRAELRDYLERDEALDPTSRDLLAAAHAYSSFWEFQIIQHANPHGYQIEDIDRTLRQDIAAYPQLDGMGRILDRQPVASFIDLLGQLRFQTRWNQTPRIPETSVLGHSLMVAIVSYYLTRELGGCERRLRNNFFSGLFHDLPEAVTRDIISPVKGAVDDFPDVIGAIERDMVSREVYPLVEPGWVEELEYFTRDEFVSKIRIEGAVRFVSSEAIGADWNQDRFDPIDGEITRISDHLAAFIEAYKASESGIRSPHIDEGRHRFLGMYRGKTLSGINVGAIYADF